MIEPMIDALTTSCRPCAEREQGDDQLRRVAEGDVEQAADARARAGASSSVARPISAAVGMIAERRGDEDRGRDRVARARARSRAG